MYRIREERVAGSEFKLIAECDGAYAGELTYQICVFDVDIAIITDLQIVKEFRRKGIATELVETAIEQIFKRPFMNQIIIQDGSESKATGRIARKLGFTDDRFLQYSLKREVR